MDPHYQTEKSTLKTVPGDLLYSGQEINTVITRLKHERGAYLLLTIHRGEQDRLRTTDTRQEHTYMFISIHLP